MCYFTMLSAGTASSGKEIEENKKQFDEWIEICLYAKVKAGEIGLCK